jgi:regulatory protein
LQNKRKKLTFIQARQKALRYCAYQERSHEEVKAKLFALGLSSLMVDELLAYLITENFLNEERFAKVFAGGKFRIKKWGRLKIRMALESKGLTKNCIRIGLAEIDKADYLKTLDGLLRTRISKLGEANIFITRDKASKYAIQHGYEPDLVWDALKKLLPG